jgi:hypothetical protein
MSAGGGVDSTGHSLGLITGLTVIHGLVLIVILIGVLVVVVRSRANILRGCVDLVVRHGVGMSSGVSIGMHEAKEQGVVVRAVKHGGDVGRRDVDIVACSI